MSYQIKSTPYFRRLVSTSKKNGQLQKLKEEYERIKVFNERTIEMKMRQVRLKRLFKEIEEIKVTAPPKRRRAVADRAAKTQEEIRMETLVKAKELGKEYSRLNALMGDRTFPKLDPHAYSTRVSADFAASSSHVDRKARTAKRINYGNQMSLSNREKFAQVKRPIVPMTEFRRNSMIEEKMQMLKQRLCYGNSRSNINMSKMPRRNLLKPRIVNKNPRAVEQMRAPESSEQDSGTLKITDQISDAASHDQMSLMKAFKTFEELQNSKLFTLGFIDEGRNENDMDAHKRALKNWRKIALLMRYRFDYAKRHRQETAMNDFKTYDYHPRESSSETGMSNFPVEKSPDQSSNSDTNDECQQDEVVIQVQNLCSTAPEKPETHRSYITENANEVSTVPGASGVNVVQFVKMLQQTAAPFAREIAKKEVMEFGVQKLRSIFESSN